MVFHIVLVAVRLAIVAAGAALAFLCYRTYRRKRENSLLHLAVGFILVTMGAVVEGALYEFLKIGLLEVHTIESAIVAAGFSVVLYAIYTTKQ